MGTRTRPHQSKSFQPNGLLPNETTSVIRPIDPVLWAKAEDRTAELISQIQPNWSSEQHRNAVASYVQRLITNCVPCQVFTFGSVPLKTYLPDGDIDLTVFSEDQNLKDSWAKEVRDMLEREEKNELAEFQVKEVQFIQAEVKIIKCLVDNIVVDISFNQLGGLCTLCFLEEVDNKINQNHLFKRSIILIKAWCYYESRILGAHHGLISTYALETLVLYTFLVFNNSFAGPLEVLYRFLEFFSKFDWANFCVSLWGPVPITSLPSMAADPPRKDGGELLLNKMFLTACSRAYSVFPSVQETQEQPFITKHFNVVDPLRINNNLGRSVSKGNFYRIRSAFSFGAQHLARILDSREDDAVAAVDQFFVNTWDRHGKGGRPDAPIVDSSHLIQVEPKTGGNLRKHSRSKQPLDNSIAQVPESDQSYSSLDSHTLVRTDDAPKDVHAHKQRNRSDLMNQVGSGLDDQYRQRHDLTEREQDDGGGENRRAKIVQNRGRTKHQFARTYSSPELTNLSSNEASQYTHNAVVEKVEKDSSSVSNYPRYPRGSSILENHAVKQATDRTSIRESSNTRDPRFNSNHASGDDDSSPTHTHQQGQDVMNLMPPIGIQSYGGHVHMPVNLSPHQLVQIPPSILGAYGHQMFAGSVPAAYKIDSDWGAVMHRSDGPPFPLHFNTVGVRADRGADVMGRLNGGRALTEVEHQDEDTGFWTDGIADAIKEIDPASEDFSTASSRKSPTSPATSSRTKASSESSWDGKPSKMTTTTVMKYHSGKKTRGGSRRATASDNTNTWQDDAEECVDQSYSDVDDDRKDWASLSTAAESVASPVTSSQVEVQQLPGLGPVHMSYPTSMLPFAPVLVRPGSHQGVAHNHGLVAFYPAGPPVPFYIHYVPSETSTSSAHSREHETSASAKDQEQLSITDDYDAAEKTAAGEHPDEGPSDIFNSDFASHWKNLQYGRFCQVSQLQHHFAYPPSIVVSPRQLQGELPFNGPNQQSPRSTNVFAQAVPASAHRGSSKPAGVPRRYGGEVSKNRNGTGTYFPNPKVLRDRQFPNPRQYRGDYNYERNEYHEREANGNFSKSRFNGRTQARYQYEKPNPKMDQTAAGAFQTDRQWDTFQHNSGHSYRSSNEHYIGTNGHAHGGYWRRGDHQPQNYHADSEPPSPDYPSPPRFPSGDNP